MQVSFSTFSSVSPGKHVSFSSIIGPCMFFPLFPFHLPPIFHPRNLTLKGFCPISNSRGCNSDCVLDFKRVLSRLTKNKILLFNSFSSVFFMFGYIGYWIFMPKYMETQFRQSASTSSLITGKRVAYSQQDTAGSLEAVA